MNACCTGCSSPSRARPSIVVIDPPETAPTVAMHDRSGWPSTITVHAPQRPSPQPYFVPVRPTSKRMKLSRFREGSLASCASPLMWIVVMIAMPDAKPRCRPSRSSSILYRSRAKGLFLSEQSDSAAQELRDRRRRVGRILEHEEVAGIDELHARVGHVALDTFVELVRLPRVVACLQHQHREIPCGHQPRPPVDPLLSERRRVEVARHRPADLRVAELLDRAHDVVVVDAALAEALVGPGDDAVRLAEDAGPLRVREEQLLRRQLRVKVI